MKVCEKCKTIMDDSMKFCPKCGQEQPDAPEAGNGSGSDKSVKIHKSDKKIMVVIGCIIIALVVAAGIISHYSESYLNKSIVLIASAINSKMSDADREKAKKKYDDQIVQLDNEIAKNKKLMEETYQYLPDNIKNGKFADEQQKVDEINKLSKQIGGKLSYGGAEVTQDMRNQYNAAVAYVKYYSYVQARQRFADMGKALFDSGKRAQN